MKAKRVLVTGGAGFTGSHLVTMMIVLKRRISVGFDTEAFWKGLVSSGVMAAVVLLVQARSCSKYLLPVYVLSDGFACLAVLCVLRTIKEEDLRLLNDYLGPRFQFITWPIRKLVANPRDDDRLG